MTAPASNPQVTASVWAADLPRDAVTPPASLWQRFLVYYARARDRRELQCLGDHLLRDIGVTRDQLPASEPRRSHRL